MPIKITMPSLSPTMEEGNLAKWLKKEGDKISMGDIIAEVETDKATMEVEATDEGILGKIIMPDGSQGVKVNAVIAILLKKGEDKSALEGFDVSANSSAAPTEAKKVEEPAKTTAPIAEKLGERVIASPLAKRIAQNEGVDISSITGTGPHGRVVKGDVLNAKSSPAAACQKTTFVPAVVGRNSVESIKVPHTMMRKVIAKRLLESKTTVPHFYLTVDCNADMLLSMREQINNAAPKGADGKPEYKISVNDFVIKASAMALKKVPAANASWSDEAAILYNNVDISVAVSTNTGLITPIVKNADQKSLAEISNEMKVLAKKARDNKLTPAEFVGGGFSISNLGMYGIKTFQAIVNPPQGAILAVGASEKKPVVDANGNIKVSEVMSLTISCDHRIIDGSLAAIFLGEIKTNLEKPFMMMV